MTTATTNEYPAIRPNTAAHRSRSRGQPRCSSHGLPGRAALVAFAAVMARPPPGSRPAGQGVRASAPGPEPPGGADHDGVRAAFRRHLEEFRARVADAHDDLHVKAGEIGLGEIGAQLPDPLGLSVAGPRRGNQAAEPPGAHDEQPAVGPPGQPGGVGQGMPAGGDPS